MPVKSYKSKYLIISVCLLTVVLILTASSALIQIKSESLYDDKIINVRIPNTLASVNILNGVNQALAALRGWMLLGEDKFKLERQKAWKTEITPALINLTNNAKNFPNTVDNQQLKKITSLLDELALEQKKIEGIAQTTQNIPSLELLFQKAVPQSLIMSKEITTMIELELTLESTKQRKTLLGIMDDVRGTLNLSLANMRTFLLSGGKKYQKNFEILWKYNNIAVERLIKNSHLFTKEQSNAFLRFKKARNIFLLLPKN